MEFNNYQLYRTTPKLSGNMKLDIVVNSSGNNLYVRDFHIRPISDLIAFNSIDEDILVRPHQLNIAKFYDQIKTDFYTAKADPDLLSDWPIVIPEHEKNENLNMQTWDDTYWGGTQRMLYSIYKTTHEILIPLWLEKASADNIEIVLSLTPEGQSRSLISKRLKFVPKKGTAYKFHNRFCEYFANYLDYTGISEGNYYCMNVDLKKNQTYLYGLNVRDGNMQTRTDFNITRNLLYRERPLLEANSLLTNAFADTHLILPQLINLNICFNALNWFPSGLNGLYNARLLINAEVYVDNKKLKKYDIYTNHQYVPRPILEDEYGSGAYLTELTYNALDYKHDYNCTDLIHKNKIVQPICHWQMRDNPDTLFNLYDGFGASYKGMAIGHFFGSVNDMSNTETDMTIPNTSPFGPKKLGDGDEVEYVLNNALHYYEEEPYFVPLSEGYSNGFRVKYEPDPNDEIQEILIAGMTTPMPFERTYYKTAETQTVTNQDYFAIWTRRYNKDGEMDLVDLREGEDTRSAYDKQYDVALYHDMDNRWNSAGFSDEGFDEEAYKAALSPWHRREINSYGIYFCPKIIDWPIKGEGKKALALLIWDQQIAEGRTSQGYIYHTKPCLQNIGFIIESLREYIAWVKTTELYKNSDSLPDSLKHLLYIFDVLTKLDDIMDLSEFPGVWYFLNTVFEKQDNSVSNKAAEIRYRKGKTSDAYVYRFDGHIKPAMYAPVAFVTGGDKHIEYTKKFGLNYFWRKAIYDKDNKEFNVHARTGVPPKFTSIQYDSIIGSSEYLPGKTTNSLLYDYPFTQTNKYKEFKWFDKSMIAQYPITLIAETDSTSTTDKEDVAQALKNLMYNKLKSQVGDALYDEQYVKSIYNIHYELLRVRHSEVDSNQLLYTYKITMTLK